MQQWRPKGSVAIVSTIAAQMEMCVENVGESA
jgi:hypothetical protein